MTPAALASEWVQDEALLARNHKKPVFPILLKGENWPLFVSTQFTDVRTSGRMPPQSFFDNVYSTVQEQPETVSTTHASASPQHANRTSWLDDLLRHPLLIALIGLIGALGAALIVVSAQLPQPAPINQPMPPASDTPTSTPSVIATAPTPVESPSATPTPIGMQLPPIDELFPDVQTALCGNYVSLNPSNPNQVRTRLFQLYSENDYSGALSCARWLFETQSDAAHSLQQTLSNSGECFDNPSSTSLGHANYNDNYYPLVNAGVSLYFAAKIYAERQRLDLAERLFVIARNETSCAWIDQPDRVMWNIGEVVEVALRGNRILMTQTAVAEGE